MKQEWWFKRKTIRLVSLKTNLSSEAIGGLLRLDRSKYLDISESMEPCTPLEIINIFDIMESVTLTSKTIKNIWLLIENIFYQHLQ